MDVHETLKAALAGDAQATAALIQMQQQGRALRLYPNGRSGPSDDGVAPIIHFIRKDGMIVLYRGQARTLIVPKARCAEYIIGLSKFIAIGLRLSEGKPAMDCTENQGWETALDPRGIAVTLRPLSQFDLVMSPWYVREWVASMMLLVDGTDDAVSDWGFSDTGSFYDVLAAHLTEPEDKR